MTTQKGSAGLVRQAYALCVIGHCGVDFERQGERFPSRLRGNARGRACRYGVEEVLEFEAQGLGAGEIELFEGESRGWMRRSREGWWLRWRTGGVCVYVDGEQFLAGVVEGQVLGGLEEAEFANLLSGNAAGGEVCDGSGCELEPDVGDIHLATEYGQANGANFADS